MRIVAAYYTHKPGGFCKRLYRLLNALAQRGNDVIYLSLDAPPNGALTDYVRWHKIPFHTDKRQGITFWAAFSLWLPIFLCYVCIRKRAERCLAFGAIYSALLAPAAMLARAPIILFMRSLAFRIDEINGKPLLIRRLSRIAERFGLRRASRVVAMTAAMAREIIQFAGSGTAPFSVLTNDIPASAKHSAHADEAPLLRIGTAGVLDKRKNISLLLQALQKVRGYSTPQRLELLIAGEGPLRRELEAECKARGLEDGVSFLGWQDTLDDLFGSIQLYVHPSLHEGVPNAALEALSSGLPLLLADTPESREVFQESELLFSLNSPESLANRLLELVSDGQAFTRLKASSVLCADRLRFDWDDAAANLVTSQL